MNIAMNPLDNLRLEVNAKISPKTKAKYGQFMTPSTIANYMAGLFIQDSNGVKLLDCGAGIGSLTVAAAASLKSIKLIEAWEIDPFMREFLDVNLRSLSLTYELHTADFITEAVQNITNGTGTRFTHAIINPPYKKISSNSEHRAALRQVGIETVNLYSAFLALTIKLLEDEGQLVAIIPRSFCNGPYYKTFRHQVLSECSIDHIHVFESRNQAFKDDDVLQENIIIKLTKSHQAPKVMITSSSDHSFSDYVANEVEFDAIVKQGDREFFLHIPSNPNEARANSNLFEVDLSNLSLAVSTGPVVDFRMKEFLEQDPTPQTVPLLYSHHFENGKLVYPKQHKKANAIRVAPETEKWLMPNGFYVLVKRFSAKEEKRRVVAHVVDPHDINTSKIGFENHWNVIHFKKSGIDEIMAKGMACFLNSTELDNHFRDFSGHTQVNATDLRNMKYPNKQVLESLGRQYNTAMNQSQIDELVSGEKI